MLKISPSNMVLFILRLHQDEFLSVREITEKIAEHFKCSIKKDTVYDLINEYQYATNNHLITRSERRTLKLIPTKLFSYPKNTAQS